MDQLVSSKPMMPIATASLYSCRSPLQGRLGMDPQVLAQVQTAVCVHAHYIRCMHSHSIQHNNNNRFNNYRKSRDRHNIEVQTRNMEPEKKYIQTELIFHSIK